MPDFPRTQEQYSRNSSECPFCGSKDIEADSFDIDVGYCAQEVSCSACGKDWWDEYKLVGYTPKVDEAAEARRLYEETGDERLRTVM